LHPCGVSNADIWQIQQGSRFADQGAFQGGESAFMHAMSNGNTTQSASAAENQTAAFIASQMHDAVSVYNAGGTSQAMFIFGLAMHPVMDVTSPAHTDANGNPIPWCGMNPFSCSQWWQHWGPQSIEDKKHLDAHPEVQEIENFMIRNWFQALTGKPLNCNGCSN